MDQHFLRNGLRFSDSSESEKSEFRNQLTFVDPADVTSSLFLPLACENTRHAADPHPFFLANASE